jgi:hypothetical protein
MNRNVPDGIYDVRYCGYREWVKNGKVVKCAKAILYSGSTRDRRSKEWGSYPDIPEINNQEHRRVRKDTQGLGEPGRPSDASPCCEETDAPRRPARPTSGASAE